VRLNLFFTAKTVDHVEAEVRTPQRAEKRSEDSRKESKGSSAVGLGKVESSRAGKRRKGRKFPNLLIFRCTWRRDASAPAAPPSRKAENYR
jgi:hypothetical protein